MCVALPALLAVLPRLRGGHSWINHLFLERTAYVSVPASLRRSMLTRPVLVAEAQGKIEPRTPAYIERQRETVHIVAGQV